MESTTNEQINSDNNNKIIEPSISIEDKEKIYNNLKHSICKIKIDDKEEKYGFLCKITNRDKNNKIPVLITNYSTLSLKYIKINKYLKISLNEDKETKNILLDDSRIYYTNKEMNITIIGIKEEIDEINSFLEIDDIIYEENNNIEDIYKNKFIYIVERPHFKRDFISISLLQKINNDTLDYSIRTAFGCICTPIFNLENNKIIGIHMNEIESKENKNICFKKIIEEFNKRNEIIVVISLPKNYKNKKGNNVYYINPNFEEINDSNVEIYINENKEAYKNWIKPDNIRFFIIKIKFNNLLTNCHKMFFKCRDITKIDLSSFNTNNITNMSYMFQNCATLTNVNLSQLNVNNVLDLSYSFSYCSSLPVLDLSSFKTEKVTNLQNMFLCCNDLAKVNLSFFNTTNVTEMSSMFKECSKLKDIDLSSLNTQNVTKMNNLFESCLELANIKFGNNNFNTSNVTSMEKMFYDCQNLLKIDELSILNTEKVTNMCGMFYNCKMLQKIDLANFDTKNVENMSKMFSRCKNLVNIDVSAFDTRKVSNMSEMFCHCTELIKIDLTNFNTENVTNMSQMFYFCSNLVKIDLSTLNIKNVIKMDKMFFNCRSLIHAKINFSGIEHEIDLYNIFFNCHNLMSFDLTSLDNSIIKKIANIFDNCVNVVAILVNKKSYLDFKFSQKLNIKIG